MKVTVIIEGGAAEETRIEHLYEFGADEDVPTSLGGDVLVSHERSSLAKVAIAVAEAAVAVHQIQ